MGLPPVSQLLCVPTVCVMNCLAFCKALSGTGGCSSSARVAEAMWPIPACVSHYVACVVLEAKQWLCRAPEEHHLLSGVIASQLRWWQCLG